MLASRAGVPAAEQLRVCGVPTSRDLSDLCCTEKLLPGSKSWPLGPRGLQVVPPPSPPRPQQAL